MLSLSPEDRKKIGDDIKTVEFGWPIGMPVSRKLETKLWEVRSALSGNRIARVLFTIIGDTMFLLHGFIKKSQKTPNKDKDIAKKRIAILNE